MSARGPWRILGIAPTEDTGAIRRAYAAALKAFDPDADPARFNALRDARDAALAQARRGPAEAADTDEPTWDEPEPESDALETPEDATDPHALAISEHYDAVFRLLFPNGQTSDIALVSDEAAAGADHLGALLDDPRLDHIEFRENAEAEIARILATAMPRSDPLLPRAVARFGWEDTRGRVDQPPAVRAITDRVDMLAFRDTVLKPAHRLHSAWRELAKPATETSRRSFGVRASRVDELLATVRARYPALEGEFDWYRVALWNPSTRKGGWRSRWWPYGLALWFGLQILGHVIDDGRSLSRGLSSRPHPVAGMPNLDPAISGNRLALPEADLGDAVAIATDSHVTLTQLTAHRPALVKLLREQWRTARAANVDREPFVTSVAKYLRQSAAAGQRVARYDLAAQFVRAELAMDLRLGSRTGTVELCGAVAGKQSVSAVLLGDDLLAQQNAVLAQSLLDTDAAPEVGTHLFTVPGEVVTASAARARLPRAQFTAAMRGDGTADARCKTRIALLQEALALPRARGLALLRAI